MSTLTTHLALMILLAGPQADDPELAPGGTSPTPEELQISWSTPTTGATPDLAVWSGGFHRELYPVLSAWARFRRRLQGELPALFEPQCERLVASLERLDRAVVLPAPDLLIDLYVRRLMLHLDGAAAACSRREFYNVVYRFSEAGSALGEIRWLLAQQGLGP